MTTTGRGWLRTFGKAGAVVVAVLAVPPVASAASSDDGTISFTGAITASPLQITLGSASAGITMGTTHTQAGDHEAGVTLTFNSSPAVTSGADIALQVIGATASRDAVAARFVDSSGRVISATDGHYQVGRDGGVLSLSPKQGDAPTRVMVVVSYD